MKYDKNIKFLIVDNSPNLRKIITQQLKNIGFSIITEAYDGMNAWDRLIKAAENNVPFMFIISDWSMPHLSGIDLLKKCRMNSVYKDVAFLFVTADAEVSHVKEAITAGVDGYVIKPFTPASFMEKFNFVYDKRFSK